MSKSEVEPREFWLREEYKNEKYEFFSCEIATRKPNLEAHNESDFKDSLHVIEYSAYQVLQKENEELKDKLKKADQDHYNIAWELEHKEYMLKVLTEALHNPGKKNKVE